MKLTITSLLVVASMSAAVHAGFRLRAAGEPSEAMITTSDRSIDNNNERELLSPWCDPATPVEWHPDYSQPWSKSGCIQVADCDSPGYADRAMCCAVQYGGQTDGACSTAGGTTATPTANPNNGKFYADYSTPWPNAGCMNTVPHPNYATMFYTTQLECCKAAFGGQTSNACVMGLPNPPTAKPSVAPTTIAPTTTLPTTLAGQGGGWYADYATAWPNAGCKNTTPLPIHVTVIFDTQLECCKAAFGGQYSGACIKGLPNPPTSKPTITTAANQSGGWYADYGTPWLTGGCKNTLPLPNHAIIIYGSQLKCCKGAFGGQTSNACVMGLPSPPTAKPTAAPTSKPTFAPTPKPTAKQTAAPAFAPTTASPSKAPTKNPSANPSAKPSSNPSSNPSNNPSSNPSSNPTLNPNANPSEMPSRNPSANPSAKPSSNPSSNPSNNPSSNPSNPSANPSEMPSRNPSANTTAQPTNPPTTSMPTAQPTNPPTTSKPTESPSKLPTTAKPTALPTTVRPSASPSKSPTTSPSSSKPTALAIISDANVVFWTTTDNFSETYLNGVQVGSTTDWTRPFSFSLTGRLRSGYNVIAVACHDSGGVAAMQAQLVLAGTTVLVGSSSRSWKYSLTNPAGWANAEFNDSSWLTPVAKAQTAGPWGNKMPINDGSAGWIWSTDPNNHDNVYFRIGFMYNS